MEALDDAAFIPECINFWGPNYDWVPDQDHGGVLMRTLQTMLMQTEGKARLAVVQQCSGHETIPSGP